MSFLASKKGEIEKLLSYMLRVAEVNHMGRVAEVRKAVTMVHNTLDYVITTEAEMKKKI